MKSVMGEELLARSADASLDRVPDHSRRIAVVEAVDRDDPGGRGDVDFGEPFAADHVDADEDQPAFAQRGPEAAANLLLARGQRSAERRVGKAGVRPCRSRW